MNVVTEVLITEDSYILRLSKVIRVDTLQPNIELQNHVVHIDTLRQNTIFMVGNPG